MSVRFDKTKQQWRFEFECTVGARRQRASKLLPRGWDRKQAEEFDKVETARLYALAKGVNQGNRTIDEAVGQYLKDKTHLKAYKEIAKALYRLLDIYEGRPISELPEIVSKYVETHTGRLSPAYIHRSMTLICGACRWVWKKHKWLEHDPAAHVVLPKVDNERQYFLTREQMLRTARQFTNINREQRPGDRPRARKQPRGLTRGKRLARAVFMIAFYSGMRIGEVCKAELVVIGGSNAFLMRDTKNGDPRIIPAHAKALVLARRFYPIGIAPDSASEYTKAALRLAGLGDFRFHDTRHSAASEMINNGVDLYTVGKVLGHRSARSTQRYAHLDLTTLKEAVGTIGKKSRTA